jgi:hypothetical protein
VIINLIAGIVCLCIALPGVMYWLRVRRECNDDRIFSTLQVIVAIIIIILSLWNLYLYIDGICGEVKQLKWTEVSYGNDRVVISGSWYYLL